MTAAAALPRSVAAPDALAPDGRLVLFDIDGTLLSSGRAARTAFVEALVSVFGTAGDVDGYRFEGRLDPVIVTELMTDAGVPADVVETRRDAALTLYLDLLENALAFQRPTLKPGAQALVEEVAASPRAVAALLTGNVERGARVKLSAAGLWHHFTFGVWGDEAPLRTGLGPIALARAEAVTGRRFAGPSCVVVGDSRHDVACGKAIGARVVAVATGRTPVEELRDAGADAVFHDFSDLERAKEAILG